jgi:hypothetical protein
MQLATCHTGVLKEIPMAYLRVLDGFDMQCLCLKCTLKDRLPVRSPTKIVITRTQRSRLALICIGKKLHGQEQYQSTTHQRLEVHRSVLSICSVQIDRPSQDPLQHSIPQFEGTVERL